MRKRIILHIGTHKTGSSALQTLFEANRDRLAAHGIWYPTTRRDPYPALPKHFPLYRAAVRDQGRFAEEVAMMSAEASDHGCDTLLISEEGFSGAEFDKLAIFGTLKPDFDIEVYCYLRRQDLFIESLWNQYAREGHEARSIVAFSMAPNIRQRSDFLRLLDFWSGIARVQAADYATARAQGISAHFSALAGLPMLGETGMVNPSPGMNAALLRTWFNAMKLKPSPQILGACRGDLRRHALGATLRQKLLTDFAAINAELARRYGVAFGPDLPEERPGPLLAPEPEFLVRLLAKISPDPPRPSPAQGQLSAVISPDDLRLAAGALRGSHPDAALRLIDAALKMRPEGSALVKLQDEIAQALAGRSSESG